MVACIAQSGKCGAGRSEDQDMGRKREEGEVGVSVRGLSRLVFRLP